MLKVEGSFYDGQIHFEAKGTPDRLHVFEKQNRSDFYAQDYPYHVLKTLRIHQFSIILKKLSHIFKNTLEIGSGDGTFIEYYQKHIHSQILGIEPSLSQDQNCQIKSDLESFQSLKKFDTVVLMDVFEHFNDPAQALKKIDGLLNGGGHIVMKVPSKQSLLYRFAKLLKIKKLLARMYQLDFPPQHFFYYDLESLKKLVEQHGFTFVQNFYVSEAPLTGAWDRLWGVSKYLKPFVYLILIGYNLVARGCLQDSLVVVFKKEEK
jgi:SAM-dependent methyltransferase